MWPGRIYIKIYSCLNYLTKFLKKQLNWLRLRSVLVVQVKHLFVDLLKKILFSIIICRKLFEIVYSFYRHIVLSRKSAVMQSILMSITSFDNLFGKLNFIIYFDVGLCRHLNMIWLKIMRPHLKMMPFYSK